MWRIGLLVAATACGDNRPARWIDAPPLPVARFQGSAVERAGLVHFIGGIASAPGQPTFASNRVDLLDPDTGTWSMGALLPSNAPHHHMAVAVLDNVLFVLGGGLQTEAVDTAYALDDAGWHRLTDPPVAHQGATAQAIGDKLYVAGGGRDETIASDELWIYDPAADTWTAGPAMPTLRSQAASCVIGGELIVGGGFAGEVTLATVEGFDPVRGTWRALPDLPTARGALGAVAIGTTCTFVGGLRWAEPATVYGEAEQLDLATLTWRTLAPLGIARHGLGVTYSDDYIFAIGGRSEPSGANADTDERMPAP